MKSTRLLIGLFLLVGFAGCSPREEKIDGSIFIVTQGGENFKLGLVTVSIFDRQQIETILEKNTVDLQNKLTAFKADLKRLDDKIEDLTKQQDAASNECDSRKQKYDAEAELAEATAKKFDPTYFWEREQPPTRTVLTDEEKQQLDSARKTVTKYYELQKQIDKLNSDYTDAVVKSGEYSQEALDKAVSNPTASADATQKSDEQIALESKIADESSKLTLEQLSLNKESVDINLADLEKREQQVADLQAMWDQYRPDYMKQSQEANRLKAEWQKSKNKADSFVEPLEENQRKTDFDTGQLQNWPTVQPQTYFTSLSTPLAISKTDADGKFSFQMPTKGESILVAQAQRQVTDHVEKYFWLIRVHSDGNPTMQVMLSNDNLITANSADSAVRFPTP